MCPWLCGCTGRGSIRNICVQIYVFCQRGLASLQSGFITSKDSMCASCYPRGTRAMEREQRVWWGSKMIKSYAEVVVGLSFVKSVNLATS